MRSSPPPTDSTPSSSICHDSFWVCELRKRCVGHDVWENSAGSCLSLLYIPWQPKHLKCSLTMVWFIFVRDSLPLPAYRANCTWLFCRAGSEESLVSEKWEGFAPYSWVLSTVKQGEKNWKEKQLAHNVWFTKHLHQDCLPPTLTSSAPTACQALCSGNTKLSNTCYTLQRHPLGVLNSAGVT